MKEEYIESYRISKYSKCGDFPITTIKIDFTVDLRNFRLSAYIDVSINGDETHKVPKHKRFHGKGIEVAIKDLREEIEAEYF